ncbi:hypothetical protein F2P81_009289 [Scophthalmus maximus]|uniref:Uncharacterized protein n=1 Tax=Scophthalmus maximus TaxID=52904 RepID=A0A6A4T171_SCOMX|nr:hypothetical protein F2P81_009289 [Scophthalmus maximus]
MSAARSPSALAFEHSTVFNSAVRESSPDDSVRSNCLSGVFLSLQKKTSEHHWPDELVVLHCGPMVSDPAARERKRIFCVYEHFKSATIETPPVLSTAQDH